MKILSLLLFCLVCITPVFAQDSTPVPTADITLAPVSIVTAEAPGGGDVNVIVNTPTETQVPTETGGLSPLLELVLGLSALLVAVSIAFEKLGNRAKAVASDPVSMSIAEKLGDSTPNAVVVPFVGALERVTNALVNVTDLLKKATDRIPESTKVNTKDLPPTSTLTTPLPLPDQSD